MAQSNQHLNLLNKLFEDVYTEGNINALDQLCTNDVKMNDPAATTMKKGIQGLKDLENSYTIAFPNKTCKIEHTWNSDDCIIATWTAHGTHKGTFHDIPATGKSIKITGISIFKFSGNKICEITQNWDRLGLYEQLGLSLHAAAHR